MIDELGFATSLYSAAIPTSAVSGGGGAGAQVGPINFPPPSSVAVGSRSSNEISSKYNYINLFSKN